MDSMTEYEHFRLQKQNLVDSCEADLAMKNAHYSGKLATLDNLL